MKNPIPYVALSCLLASECVIGQVSDTANYFPLAAGNTYEYYESKNCPPSPSIPGTLFCSSVLRDPFQINGKKYFQFPCIYYGNDTVSIPTAGKVYYLYGGRDQLFYNLNGAVGDTWQTTLPLVGSQPNTFVVTLESRTDTIRVSCGVFTNCLRIHFRAIGASVQFIHWLAPNVGLVFACVDFAHELHEAVVNGIRYSGATEVLRSPEIVDFVLNQNYPNPFNPETTIEYEIAKTSIVRLSILDLVGREVIKLMDTIQSAGRHTLRWDGRDKNLQVVASGVYFCRLVVGNAEKSKKLVLIK